MGTFAPFFEYLRVITDFLVARGMATADADQLIATTFVDVARPLGAWPADPTTTGSSARVRR